ncbi:MAG: hypothetical protein M0P31_16915 [Solirubrobacteraceae bacterium]|nr:hypothetical protein [Solirubrobacteraceae bacterium]
MSGRVRARRASSRASLGVAAVLAALAVTGCGDSQRFGNEDPRRAVSRFLVLTVGQANGQKGCAMLTRELRTQLDEGPAGSCRRAMGTIGSLLPGERDEATSFEQVTSGLDFTTPKEDDASATVRVVGRGTDVTFGLVRLPDDQRAGSDGGDPDTRWRIASGLEQLLGEGAAAPGR